MSSKTIKEMLRDFVRCFWPIILFALLILGIIFLSSIWVEAQAETYTPDEIVEAIGRAENSIKYPYGIKSINTNSNKEYARKICYNSVVNNYRRWIKAEKPIGFLEFIAKRFCLIGAKDDPNNLNINWIRNVKYWLIKNRGNND